MFPRSRDKMKLILRELDLPFYAPFLIIEKTKGKMAEDEQLDIVEELYGQHIHFFYNNEKVDNLLTNK